MTKANTGTQRLIDDYIVNLPSWSKSICEKLRIIIHKADPNLVEDWKWTSPAFSHNGTLICWFWAFSKNARLFFFEGALMHDPKKLFNPARSTKRNRSIEFTDVSEVDEKILISYMREAIALNKAGKHVKIPVSKNKTVNIPHFIKKILEKEKLLSKFEAQIYTYRKGYVNWIGEAKQEKTKRRRIDEMVGEIREGKKYMGMAR